MQDKQNQPKGVRIARNAILLYVRMLVLLFVGLFTSRVVLSALGVEDFGVYTAVGGIVVLFSVLTTAVSNAISRFMSFQLGKGDMLRLKEVFGVSRVMLVLLCVLLLILTETLGLWFLQNCMNIPAERMTAATWVLQCSMGIMMVNLLAIPYNALLISREKMDVFALVSIVEGVLKLAVAYLLYLSSHDKLVTYALLMLAVALIVRSLYSIYCKKNYAESRFSLRFTASSSGLVKEMFSFAGWNTLGSATLLVNTQGINILQNVFFGVLVNAGRGIAMQVEGIFKQFASNIMLAFNPQIVKSYANGDLRYCYLMVQRASKFTYLVQVLLAIPIWIECEYLLHLWLGQVPDYAVTFVRLAILCTLVDMSSNALFQLIQASGKIRKYSLLSSLLALTVFPLSWWAYQAGASPESSYWIFAGIYSLIFIWKGLMAKELTAFPLGAFVRLFFRLLLISVLAFVCAQLVYGICACQPFVHLILVTLTSTVVLAVLSYFLVLTDGEKQYLRK
ncbi:MAG: lipopolysaccharide biosynthesis protein [Bacteroidales bacterium]|nr:lipopolysaccharide biosynthesis protein [Bacteroidales bacterium]